MEKTNGRKMEMSLTPLVLNQDKETEMLRSTGEKGGKRGLFSVVGAKRRDV